MSTIPHTDLILIRHGEPELAGTMLGWTDSPLTERGWCQLAETCRALPLPEVMVSSPLARCARFARALCEEQGRTLVEDDAWRECHFGEWDGLAFQEITARSPEALAQYYRHPADIAPPGGEAFMDFTRRIETAIQDALTRYAGKRVGIFCHSGVIRTAIAWCLQMNYQQAAHIHHLVIDYASVTKIRVYQQGQEALPQLLCTNWLPGNP